jgi:hypothetical protein
MVPEGSPQNPLTWHPYFRPLVLILNSVVVIAKQLIVDIAFDKPFAQLAAILDILYMYYLIGRLSNLNSHFYLHDALP